jgi:hypothetical protein
VLQSDLFVRRDFEVASGIIHRRGLRIPAFDVPSSSFSPFFELLLNIRIDEDARTDDILFSLKKKWGEEEPIDARNKLVDSS